MSAIHKIFVEPDCDNEGGKPVLNGMINIMVDFDEMGENFFVITIDPSEASDFRDQLAKTIEVIDKEDS